MSTLVDAGFIARVSLQDPHPFQHPALLNLSQEELLDGQWEVSACLSSSFSKGSRGASKRREGTGGGSGVAGCV
ncbi:hypothetical protein BO71DRAFT_393866 [Aspergillus ellipticus CBS 707.79]|uniref:Uncharacterized protein n=1 Tax=Aspergillus ellipticus CBS 707.79 TaxID=1448320 RepID=A0A319E0C3_9EURO|nr:hypothetical protein BO71DRAFT_393866 [Aspergillus ellipticus CBS 707.79]